MSVASTELSADSVIHRTDGATREATGDFGLVVKEGTNLLFTDLAPGATAGMVGTTLCAHVLSVLMSAHQPASDNVARPQHFE